jgi:hypothetical protein
LYNNKLLNKLAYSLKDCYGFDKLSKYLYIVGLMLSIIRLTAPLGLALTLYGSFRCFSKNRYRRYQELAAYERFLASIKGRVYKSKSSVIQFKQYKVFKCPNCSQKLRVPRRQGKIVISCKKCSTEFRGKS